MINECLYSTGYTNVHVRVQGAKKVSFTACHSDKL